MVFPNSVYRANSRTGSAPAYSRDTLGHGTEHHQHPHAGQGNSNGEVRTVLSHGYMSAGPAPLLVRTIPIRRAKDQTRPRTPVHTDTSSSSVLFPIDQETKFSSSLNEPAKRNSISPKTNVATLIGRFQAPTGSSHVPSSANRNNISAGHKPAYGRMNSNPPRSLNRYAVSDSESTMLTEASLTLNNHTNVPKRHERSGSEPRTGTAPTVDIPKHQLENIPPRKRSSLAVLIKEDLPLSADPMGNITRVPIGGGKGAHELHNSTGDALISRNHDTKRFAQLPPQRATADLTSNENSPIGPVRSTRKKSSDQPHSILKNGHLRHSLPRMRTNTSNVVDIELNESDIRGPSMFPLRNANSYSTMAEAIKSDLAGPLMERRPVRTRTASSGHGSFSDVEHWHSNNVTDRINRIVPTSTSAGPSSISRSSLGMHSHTVTRLPTTTVSQSISAYSPRTVRPPSSMVNGTRNSIDLATNTTNSAASSPIRSRTTTMANSVRTSLELTPSGKPTQASFSSSSFSVPTPAESLSRSTPNVVSATERTSQKSKILDRTPSQSSEPGSSPNRVIPMANGLITRPTQSDFNKVSVSLEHKGSPSRKNLYAPVKDHAPISVSKTGTQISPGFSGWNGHRPIVVDSRTTDPSTRPPIQFQSTVRMNGFGLPPPPPPVTRSGQTGSIGGRYRSSLTRLPSECGPDTSHFTVDQSRSTEEAQRVVSSDPGIKRRTPQVSFNLDQNQCVEFSNSDRPISHAKRIQGYISSTGEAPGEGDASTILSRPIPSKHVGAWHHESHFPSWITRASNNLTSTGKNHGSPRSQTTPSLHLHGNLGTGSGGTMQKTLPPAPPRTNGVTSSSTADRAKSTLMLHPTTMRYRPGSVVGKSLYRDGRESRLFSDVEFYESESKNVYDPLPFRQEIRHQLPIDMFNRMH